MKIPNNSYELLLHMDALNHELLRVGNLFEKMLRTSNQRIKDLMDEREIERLDAKITEVPSG